MADTRTAPKPKKTPTGRMYDSPVKTKKTKKVKK
jgi:hypothetical protein